MTSLIKPADSSSKQVQTINQLADNVNKLADTVGAKLSVFSPIK